MRRTVLGAKAAAVMIVLSFSMGALVRELIVRPESPNKSKQQLYRVCTVTVESHDVRRFLAKSLALSENECVSV